MRFFERARFGWLACCSALLFFHGGCECQPGTAARSRLDQFSNAITIYDEGTEDEEGEIYAVDINIPKAADHLDEILTAVNDLPHIQALKLSEGTLSAEQLRVLKPLPSLRSLAIHSACSDELLTHLPKFPNLEALDIEGTDVTGQCFSHMQCCGQLKILRASHTPLKDIAIEGLIQNAKKLKSFWFADTRVTASGVMKLSQLLWLKGIGPPDDLLDSESEAELSGDERRKFLSEQMAKRRTFMLEFWRARIEAIREAESRGEDTPSASEIESIRSSIDTLQSALQQN